MALPTTATNFMAFFRSVVSVLFLGRLGSLELAGGALSLFDLGAVHDNGGCYYIVMTDRNFI
jgi:hypothetical protein